MICFTWWGLTQYAARAIEAFNKVSGESVCVVATRPRSSPVQGMECVLSCPIVWVDENDVGFASKLPEIPRVLFVSNWNLPCWKYLENIVKSNGGVAVAMIDTNYRCLRIGNGRFRAFVKQCAWMLRFRLAIRRRFYHFFVVGASGQRLMRFCGVSDSNVSLGLYGADSSLFHDGAPLIERPKRIIYVGQFIERKNVRRMIQAFAFAKKIAGGVSDEWRLDLYGAGVLVDELVRMAAQSGETVGVHAFLQPEDLAAEYRNARVFCLPSIEEHWGLVVHEAALSGCALLLANGVGAAEDFLCAKNGISFSPSSVGDMAKSIVRVMSWRDEQWAQAQSESVRLAAGFGLHRFVKSTEEICTSKAW